MRGDQRAVRIGVEGVLLVRDRDGELRAFYNVCRHRGHELLEAGSTRNRNAIRCPYHAWVYGLDGHLAGTPRFGEAPGLRREELVLVPVPVQERDGWVFVDVAGEEPAVH
jgi:Rieske 2Fe-2S family protein